MENENKKAVTNTAADIKAEPSHKPDSKRIVLNSNKCTACLSCELACSAAHFGVYSNTLSAIRIQADFRNRKYLAEVCQQCASAACMDACPDKVKAMRYDEETGAKYIDLEKCIGCGKCAKACPFQETPFPLIKKVKFEGKSYIVKCDLCHGKENGPACIAACPNSALTLED